MIFGKAQAKLTDVGERPQSTGTTLELSRGLAEPIYIIRPSRTAASSTIH